MMQGKGINRHAYEEWKNWVNKMHGEHNPNGIKTPEQVLFVDMWYPDMGEASSITERTMSWKFYVQQAFLEGYEAGFTDRIFNGEQHD